MQTAILLFLPLLGAFTCLLFKKEAQIKGMSLVFSLATLGVSLFAWYQQSLGVGDEAFRLDYPWMPAFGIHFKIGMDGISLLMVFLTDLLTPIILLTAYKRETARPGAFYFLILFMQMGLTGVFIAQDAFLFYVFWETALVPIYFISGIWGGTDRVKVTLKFFIYTLFGSLLMLTGILYLHFKTPNLSFDLSDFYSLNLPYASQAFIFITFFLAFAIKMPIFPFHTWQADTYATSPYQGSMLLAGIMLKMGIYGVIRWLMPLAPLALASLGPYVMILSVVGIVYASVIAIRQNDMKRLIAYSSLAHVGLISAGVFANNFFGIQGSMVQMLSHGINVIGLFYVVSLIQEQTGTRSLLSLGGIAIKAPYLSTCFAVILLGTVALPLTNGFVGEFLLLNGIFKYDLVLSVVAGSTLVFGAVYLLRMFQKAMLGPLNPLMGSFKEVSGTDKATLALLTLLILFIGIYPKPILDLTASSVAKIILEVNNKIMVNN